MRPANATARYRRITPDPVLCKNTFGSIENRAPPGPSGLSRNLCSHQSSQDVGESIPPIAKYPRRDQLRGRAVIAGARSGASG
jgi:hypothetical protein